VADRHAERAIFQGRLLSSTVLVGAAGGRGGGPGARTSQRESA
jgi:hypothetical protein